MKGDMKFSTILALIFAVAVLVLASVFIFPPIWAIMTGTGSSIKLGQYCTHWSINGYEGHEIVTPQRIIPEPELAGMCGDALRLDHDVSTPAEWDQCRCWCNKTCGG